MTIDINLLNRITNNDRSLTSIDLHNTNPKLDDDDARALANALRSNSSVTHINIGDNSIGESGIRCLVEKLEGNTSVQSLSLYGNPLGGNSIDLLGRLIRNNHSIKELNLGHTGITDNGVTELADALSHNASLRILILSYNNIGLIGATKLYNRGLQGNSTIQSISLIANPCDNSASGELNDIRTKITDRLNSNVMEYGRLAVLQAQNQQEDDAYCNKFDNKRHKQFYRHFKLRLQEFHDKAKKLHNGEGVPDQKRLKEILGGVQDGADLIPVPFLTLAAKCLSKFILWADEKHEMAIAEAVEQTVTKKLIPEVAYAVTKRYERQIAKLTFNGVKVLADCAQKRTVSYLVSLNEADRDVRQLHERVDLMIRGVIEGGRYNPINTKLDESARAPKEIRAWTAEGVLRRTGLEVNGVKYIIKGSRFFGKDPRKSRPLKYNYSNGEGWEIDHYGYKEESKENRDEKSSDSMRFPLAAASSPSAASSSSSVTDEQPANAASDTPSSMTRSI